MTPRKRPAVAAAAVFALLLPLVSCSLLPPAPRTTSTPTGEDVAADLEPFYSQVLRWSDCGNGLQCTTAQAPLDWSDPSRESIDLALVRQPATTRDRIGSLLVNPGGPGASGVDFILNSVDYATSERLQSRFDVVGFDPRGVNRSTPVDCYDDPAELDRFLYDLSPHPRGSDEWVDDLTGYAADFAADCLEHTGELLGFVDTNSAARDLDLLRAVLGDEKLNYLGYSYGTLLGASYAELYPQKTGRLVFDGAVDPSTSLFEVSAAQAQGFESALHAYLEQCIGSEGCPFSGSVASAISTIQALLESLDASPIRNEDGRQLGASTMFPAIIFPLYSQSSWPTLTEVFATVMRGEASFAFTVADSYNDRNPDGTYRSNKTEAFVAINCLDYGSNPDLESMRQQAAELADLAPVFGPLMGYGDTSCAHWPFPPTRERVEIHAEGSADILVIGTTNDPATPYQWAQNLASQLENGHLVTHEGEGHTAYNKSNECVLNTVDDYFIEGTVPDADPRC